MLAIADYGETAAKVVTSDPDVPRNRAGRFKEIEMATECMHVEQIRDVEPSAQGCEECLKTGDEWVELRMCLTCGHVGCCDSSPNKHATRHFHETRHPIIQSFGSGERWRWCYVDQAMLG